MDDLEKSLTQEQGAEALKTMTERNQILAASLGSNLTSGILRFRSDVTGESNSNAQGKQSSLKQTSQKRYERPRVQDITKTSEHDSTHFALKLKKLLAIRSFM